ncbi:MAG: hypothetical protein HYV90_04320 [Candidatus Woesebacteria bacterium]|nr:MAG: hypothetical protein HYV90_04320 [Candidatus Woesebacteria bacterium]
MILVFEVATKDWNVLTDIAGKINTIITRDRENLFIHECIFKRYTEPYYHANLDNGKMLSIGEPVIFAYGLRHCWNGDPTKISLFCSEVKEATGVEIIPL